MIEDKIALEAYRNIIGEMLEEYHIATEKLTKQQMADAMAQAILCGDFQRHVMSGMGQQVVYIPYQREQELLGKLAEANKWYDAQTHKPMDDTDCVVVFTVDGQKQIRAPVFWWAENGHWQDEFANFIPKEHVLKFMLLENL